MVEAILIQERFDGIRPTVQAFGDEGWVLQEELEQNVKSIIESTKEILEERDQL